MSDQSIIHIALTYLVVINVVTFFVYGIDKWKAKKSKWRVPEALIRRRIILPSILSSQSLSLPSIRWWLLTM